jgi:hypothetical protein
MNLDPKRMRREELVAILSKLKENGLHHFLGGVGDPGDLDVPAVHEYLALLERAAAVGAEPVTLGDLRRHMDAVKADLRRQLEERKQSP